jgi:hypothetical protein
VASTTFIDLTNKLLRRLNEVEISESDFPSARGVHAMAKDAINASVELICQAEFTWPFNASTGTQVLTVGQEEYSWPSDLKVPNWRSFFIVKDDALDENGHLLRFISRDEYHANLKADDDYSGSDGIGNPAYVFEKHGSGFGVSPSPAEAYTVTFEYWVNNIAMDVFGDTSTIPSNYDETIIQGALYHFYMFRDNSEQAQLAEKRFDRQLSDMRTLMINKEDRLHGATEYFRRNSSSAAYGASVDGSTWIL